MTQSEEGPNNLSPTSADDLSHNVAGNDNQLQELKLTSVTPADDHEEVNIPSRNHSQVSRTALSLVQSLPPELPVPLTFLLNTLPLQSLQLMSLTASMRLDENRADASRD